MLFIKVSIWRLHEVYRIVERDDDHGRENHEIGAYSANAKSSKQKYREQGRGRGDAKRRSGKRDQK